MSNEPRTHDYTWRVWGHDFIQTPKRDGMVLRMMGWGDGIKAGDYLLLPNGSRSTRYRIRGIRYFRDPPDMWRAVAQFAPRPAGASSADSTSPNGIR